MVLNFLVTGGHQNAILAGLLQTKEFCDATISIDADLQDDIDILDEFIQKFYDGCDIIYGVRKSRKRILYLRGIRLNCFIN